jgi:transposase-like protein
MAGKKGMSWYSIEYRLQILNEHANGLSFSSLSKQYNIDERVLKRWSKWKRENGIPKQITGKVRKGRPRAKPESLEEENKRLKMENALLKKFNELLMEEETKRK